MQHRKRGVVADAREDQAGASRLAHLRLVDAEGNVTPVEMNRAEPHVNPTQKKNALEGFDWVEFNQRPAALQLLTIPQVAAIEGVCVWKIRQLDKAGAYPHATGDGKGRRILLADLVATRTPAPAHASNAEVSPPAGRLSDFERALEAEQKLQAGLRIRAARRAARLQGGR